MRWEFHSCVEMEDGKFFEWELDCCLRWWLDNCLRWELDIF